MSRRGLPVSPVAVPADKRFRRAHVKPARARRSWRAWTGAGIRAGLVVAGVAFAAYRGPSMLAQTRVLRIQRIVVHGNERMSSGEVLAVLGGLRGQSLIWTDLGVWRGRLLSSAWVRDANLRRSLPSTVEVAVIERQPIGVARIDGRLYLLDDRAVLIDEYGPQYADFDLPIIDGLPAPVDDGLTTDPARTELAARVIAALKAKPDVGRRVSQIDVHDVHNAGVILAGDGAAVHLGDQQFLRRLQSYLELASALRERVADIDYVDMRFDGRVYVKPAGKPGASVNTGKAVKPGKPAAQRR